MIQIDDEFKKLVLNTIQNSSKKASPGEKIKQLKKRMRELEHELAKERKKRARIELNQNESSNGSLINSLNDSSINSSNGSLRNSSNGSLINSLNESSINSSNGSSINSPNSSSNGSSSSSLNDSLNDSSNGFEHQSILLQVIADLKSQKSSPDLLSIVKIKFPLLRNLIEVNATKHRTFGGLQQSSEQGKDLTRVLYLYILSIKGFRKLPPPHRNWFAFVDAHRRKHPILSTVDMSCWHRFLHSVQ